MTSPSTTNTTTIMTPANVDDYQVLAKAKLPKALYEYLASGTDDEQTLAENRSAFKNWYLRPRVMRPIKNLTTATTLFGRAMSMPVFCSPAGVHALCEPAHGECATARACGRLNILMGVSQHATRSIEQVAQAAPETNKWFQAYILKDRDKTLRIVQRAVAAGYRGIFLTVDSVRFGYREADARNGFNALPPPHRLVNYDDEIGDSTKPSSKMEETYNAGRNPSWDQNTELLFEEDLSWDDVRWLKQAACQNLPLIIKGIMTAEDALLAMEAGADGIMVSNHGGRQLDSCLSSVDALPEVVEAVAGRVPVLLDGGVRRGTDVVKALALGATAVGIGKPMFFALAVGGEEALVAMLKMYKREIEAAMALCGCRTVADITPKHVSRHPNGMSAARYIRSSL